MDPRGCIDSRDVLDPNARTIKAFKGRILGYFRRIGPNVWDDYEFVEQEGGILQVSKGIRIQLEPDAARFRMRRKGRVWIVDWQPDQNELSRALKTEADAREFFVSNYLADYQSPPGWGLAAVIAKKLKDE